MSAIAVTAYKYFLYSTNDANGAAIGILPVAILFVVPAVVAVAYVVIRSVLGMVLARLFRCESTCIQPTSFLFLRFYLLSARLM